MSLSAFSRSYLDRVKVGVSSTMDLSHLSSWLEQNTRHPKDNLLAWSFLGHEFQLDILNDASPYVMVRKCSQVGLSEVVVRMALALVAVLRNHTAIYTLPTAGDAAYFAKTRFDPVIASSKTLSGMLDPDNDSSSLKQLGTSFLYIKGTFTQKAAISVPADILLNDEVDFSDQRVLTTYSSRLGHAKNGGLRREFSTPTRNGYGISKTFDRSTQAYRGVRCSHCHQMVFPYFFDDVIIPGFDDPIDKLEREDLHDPRYDIANAYLSCPECHGELTVANLINPELREWVHKYPSRGISGYQVYPYDVASINPVSHTLQELDRYDRKADWVNFKIGLPFEDAESSFIKDILYNARKLDPKKPPSEYEQDAFTQFGTPTGLVMGVDVGKLSHIVVGRPRGRSQYDILWLERVRQTGDGTLLKRLVFLTKWFGISKAVIDAGPDFTTAMAFVEAFKMSRVFANYYVRQHSRTTLSHITINEEEGIVSSVRTESFDLLSKKANAGAIQLPRLAETELLIDHLGNMKRVEVTNNQGDAVANWVTDGPDHYAHALNYMAIAATLLEDRFAVESIVGVLPMAVLARMKTPT